VCVCACVCLWVCEPMRSSIRLAVRPDQPEHGARSTKYERTVHAHGAKRFWMGRKLQVRAQRRAPPQEQQQQQKRKEEGEKEEPWTTWLKPA